MNYIFLDLETLGLSPSPENPITQIAYIITSPEGEELKKFDSYIFYDETWKDKIDNFEYNQVNYEDCKNGLPLEKVFKQLFKDIKKYDVSVFNAYNVTFDFKFIFKFANDKQKKILSNLNKHCIMRNYCYVFDIERWQKLTDVFADLFFKEFEAHNAINDVEEAKHVYFALVPLNKRKEKDLEKKRLKREKKKTKIERVRDLTEHEHLFSPYQDKYLIKGAKGHTTQYRKEVMGENKVLLEFGFNFSKQYKRIIRIWHNQFGGGYSDVCRYEGNLEGRFTISKDDFKKIFDT